MWKTSYLGRESLLKRILLVLALERGLYKDYSKKAIPLDDKGTTMKVSELIKELESLKEEFGDIECRYSYDYRNHGASTTFYDKMSMPIVENRQNYYMLPQASFESYFDGKLKDPFIKFF